MIKTAWSLAFGMVALIFSYEVQAFPIASVPDHVGGPEVLQVRGFCGLGFHRGPYGYCVRNGVPYGYGAPVVVGPAVVVAPPMVVAPRACPFGYAYAPAYGGCVPL